MRQRFLPKGEYLLISEDCPETLRLSVCCRVKPIEAEPPREDDDLPTEGSKMALPLHQRLALLRQAQPELTQKEALQKALSKATSATDGTGDESTASAAGLVASVLSVTGGPRGSILTASPGIGIRSWEFDHVFGERSSQFSIYLQSGRRLATDLVNGTNGALIVYGQTGSGKTHTMFGPRSSFTSSSGPPSEQSSEGLVPRVASEVLDALETRKAQGFEVRLGASYVEVFGNDVSDLLGGTVGISHAEMQRMGHRHILEGKCEKLIPDRETMFDLLQQGEENKRQASTAMNERSSRAHTLVILRLRQKAPGQRQHVESFLSLVDLGGSGRLRRR